MRAPTASRLSDRLEAWSECAYRSLLQCYPAEFRHEYTNEMALLFADRCRQERRSQGLPGVLMLWLQAVAELSIEAPKEHLDMIWQDLRYSLRMMRKTPGFSAIVIAVLALGIGVNSIVFSLVNALLIRPLPYPQPERLMAVGEGEPNHTTALSGLSFPVFLDVRARNRVFEDIGSYFEGGFSISHENQAERVPGAHVSAGLFRILGISPIQGRFFLPEEDVPSARNVVILGYNLWQNRFAGDPAIAGGTIVLSGVPTTVVGVMPRGFQFPEAAELWVPMALDEKLSPRTDCCMDAIARLKPGVTVEQARAEVASLMAQVNREHPMVSYGHTADVAPLKTYLTEGYRDSSLTLFAAVVLVFLIAGANVANLLLIKSSARSREMAIRGALGAGRGRVVRQLMVESLLFSGIGGAAGLALTFVGIPAILKLIPIPLPYWMRFNVDGRVLAFTVLISILTSVFFGLAPALQSTRISLTDSLKEGGKGGSTGVRRQRFRSALVVAEVALSLMLLVGAGLMVRSFLLLRGVQPGFDSHNLLTARVSLPGPAFAKDEIYLNFDRRLMRELSSIPGVKAVAATSTLPLADGWGRSFTAEGAPELDLKHAPNINHAVVTPGYFRAMGIPLLAGRDFTDADSKSHPVTIVDQTLARRYWPNQGAIGRRVRYGPPENKEPWHTIVGVVGDIRCERLQLQGDPNVYIPSGEHPLGGMYVLLRGAGVPANYASSLRRKVAAVQPEAPVSAARSMQEVIGIGIWIPRFFTILFALFAAVALTLASVGLYGVMSYMVAQRAHEMGVRMALGAGAREVQGMVMRQGMRLALIGVVLGAIGAAALTRLMASQLFGVRPNDGLTFGSVSALLIVVALLASYLPARRATRVDPLIALRCE